VTPGYRGAARWSPVGVIGVLLTVVLALSATSAAAQDWQEVMDRAAQVARSASYEGEALLLSVSDERPHLSRVKVRHVPADGLVIGGDEGAQLLLGADGGGFVDQVDAAVPLPRIELGSGDDLRRLEEKYDVVVAGVEHLMNRACTMVEIRRRADGDLRERLWFDDESGLLVRRETFEGEPEPVRMAAYLSLDLDARRVQASAARAAKEGGAALRSDEEAARGSARKVLDPLEEREVTALREAGWFVPDALPDGYGRLGTFTVDAGTSHPLQLVYGDGLYVVSVFQQHGTPDWSSLPAGASRVDALDFEAYEWPGAVPQRLVWETDGRTWSVVGDAPPGELLSLAAALPRDTAPGLLERLRRGLGRLWGWVTP
jgi:negative regulator of sigma E activity